MNKGTNVSVECGSMVEEWRDAPTPSGRVKTRVRCSGLAVGDVHDKFLKCNNCGAEKNNPYYEPPTDEKVHVSKKVDY